MTREIGPPLKSAHAAVAGVEEKKIKLIRRLCPLNKIYELEHALVQFEKINGKIHPKL